MPTVYCVRVNAAAYGALNRTEQQALHTINGESISYAFDAERPRELCAGVFPSGDTLTALQVALTAAVTAEKFISEDVTTLYAFFTTKATEDLDKLGAFTVVPVDGEGTRTVAIKTQYVDWQLKQYTDHQYTSTPV